jgi:hypothetical protein
MVTWKIGCCCPSCLLCCSRSHGGGEGVQVFGTAMSVLVAMDGGREGVQGLARVGRQEHLKITCVVSPVACLLQMWDLLVSYPLWWHKSQLLFCSTSCEQGRGDTSVTP